MLQFYVLMDEEKYGPYSTQEIIDLKLLDDILVLEESMDEWYSAELFDFQELLELEQNSVNRNLNQVVLDGYNIGEDGVIKRNNLVPDGYEIGEDGVIKRKNVLVAPPSPSTYTDSGDGWKTFGKVLLTIIVLGGCVAIALTAWGTIPAVPIAVLTCRAIWKD